jgi:hypothetical protein
MRRFQRSRRNLPARPKKGTRQMDVPQLIWNTTTDIGMLKISEACSSVKDEDFQVFGEDQQPLCVVRCPAGQTIGAWFNLSLVRVTAGVITDGCSIRNPTTRGGIRGPDGMTLGPFSIRLTAQV